MFSKVLSATIDGARCVPVCVEADVSNGLPMFSMVGDLTSQVKEAQERVRTAIKNMGITIPAKRITVNLSPADIRKAGSRFDLPIAAALLAAFGLIEKEKLEKPRISPEFMTFWLHRFRKLDVRQQAHRKMLIDAFVNAIYLYDDKLVLTFNYKDGTRTITLDDVKEAAKANTGSDLDCRGAPNNRDTPLGCPGY